MVNSIGSTPFKGLQRGSGLTASDADLVASGSSFGEPSSGLLDVLGATKTDVPSSTSQPSVEKSPQFQALLNQMQSPTQDQTFAQKPVQAKDEFASLSQTAEKKVQPKTLLVNNRDKLASLGVTPEVQSSLGLTDAQAADLAQSASVRMAKAEEAAKKNPEENSGKSSGKHLEKNLVTSGIKQGVAKTANSSGLKSSLVSSEEKKAALERDAQVMDQVKAQMQSPAQLLAQPQIQTEARIQAKSQLATPQVQPHSAGAQQYKAQPASVDGKSVSKADVKALMNNLPETAVPAKGADTVVVQPIVIQMPQPQPQVRGLLGDLLIPAWDFGTVPLVETSFVAEPLIPLSQDFLAERGTLSSAMKSVGRELSAQKNKAGIQNQIGLEPMSLMMPQVVGFNRPGVEVSQTFSGPQFGADEAIKTQGRINLKQPLALASHVKGLAANGGGAIQMKIVPESLGELTISVQSRGNHLQIHFEAQTPEAKNALMHSLPELQQALTANQFEIDRLDVGLSQGAKMAWTGSTPILDSSNQGVVGMSYFGGSSDFSSSHQESFAQNPNGGGSAWERYQAQQEARFGDGRQNHGHRQYRDFELGFGA